MLLFPVSPVASSSAFSPAPIITTIALVNHSRCPLLQPPLLPVASHPFIFSACCLSTVAHTILHLLPAAFAATSFAFSHVPTITVAALVGYSRCPPIQPLMLPIASHPFIFNARRLSAAAHRPLPPLSLLPSHLPLQPTQVTATIATALLAAAAFLLFNHNLSHRSSLPLQRPLLTVAVGSH
ncbi:hypothetical protein BHM03_00040693 [Ensete ventricosum]|nr:hypothetical protein BHM03_00040693 [Ensete ventricosum]